MGKIIRSLKLFFYVRELVRIKNRELRERDEVIIVLRRKLFFAEQHKKAVEELSAKEIPTFGKTHRAGLQ